MRATSSAPVKEVRLPLPGRSSNQQVTSMVFLSLVNVSQIMPRSAEPPGCCPVRQLHGLQLYGLPSAASVRAAWICKQQMIVIATRMLRDAQKGRGWRMIDQLASVQYPANQQLIVICLPPAASCTPEDKGLRGLIAQAFLVPRFRDCSN